MEYNIVDRQDDGTVVIHAPGMAFDYNWGGHARSSAGAKKHYERARKEGQLVGSMESLTELREVKGDDNVRVVVSGGTDSHVPVPVELMVMQQQKHVRLVDFMCLKVVPAIDHLMSIMSPDTPSLFEELLREHREDMSLARMPFPVRHNPANPTPQDISAAAYEGCAPVIEEEKRRIAKRERELEDQIEAIKRELGEVRAKRGCLENGAPAPKMPELGSGNYFDNLLLDDNLFLDNVGDLPAFDENIVSAAAECVVVYLSPYFMGGIPVGYQHVDSKTGNVTLYSDQQAEELTSQGRAFISI